MEEVNEIVKEDTKQSESNGRIKETWDESTSKREHELVEDEEAERKRARLEVAFEPEWNDQPNNEQEEDKASSLEGSSNRDEYYDQDIEEWGFADSPTQNLVELTVQTNKSVITKVITKEDIINRIRNFNTNELNNDIRFLEPVVPLRPFVLPDFNDDLDEPRLVIDERVQDDIQEEEAVRNNNFDFHALLAQYERDTNELLRMVEEFGGENTIELSSSSEDEGEYAKRKRSDPDKPGTSKSSQ